MQKALSAAAVLALYPATTFADQVFTDDVIVSDDLLCVGLNCADGEPNINNRSALKLKGINTAILFDDQSETGSFPTHDWQLNANETMQSGRNAFFLSNLTAGTDPFWVEGGAPDNALYVDDDGDVGLGTAAPLSPLHIVSASGPTIRLEDASGTPYAWEVGANADFWYIRDVTALAAPVGVEAGTPGNTFVIRNTGRVGIGTSLPEAPLELESDETFNYFRITADGAEVNQSVDITFTEGPLRTGELRYNIVDGDGPEMRLNADGDLRIDGTLTTAGSCSVGCDAVFDAGYPLPSISDHLAETLALGHLPNVGPTRDGEAWDVTDKMGRMLNELEHAHLYIGQLHATTTAQEARIEALSAQVAALTARLDAQQD
ncbi:MAG: hypothetical protein RIA08_09300 [Roseovarius sp.]|uniref:hypothetical protein n=1 Tax=Roseobacteraceae TaxID=2854170 RepID=UPI0032EEDB29